MKHLYFIRHGLSTANVTGHASGHVDSELTPIGRAQAAAAGKAARDAGLVFDVILSSPLQRAHHSAQAMAEYTGYPIDKIELLAELKERFFGDAENKNLFESYNVSLEDYMADVYAVDHIPNIETFAQLHARVEQMLEELLKRSEDTVLVVGHGAYGRSLQRVVSGLPIDSSVPLIDNATLIKLI